MIDADVNIATLKTLNRIPYSDNRNFFAPSHMYFESIYKSVHIT